MTTNYSKNLWYVISLSLLLFSISFLANSDETTSNAYETTTSTTTSTESDVNTYDVNNSDVNNNNANMLEEKKPRYCINCFLLYAHKSCAFILIFLKSLKFLRPKYFLKYKSNALKYSQWKSTGNKVVSCNTHFLFL